MLHKESAWAKNHEKAHFLIILNAMETRVFFLFHRLYFVDTDLIKFYTPTFHAPLTSLSKIPRHKQFKERSKSNSHETEIGLLLQN